MNLQRRIGAGKIIMGANSVILICLILIPSGSFSMNKKGKDYLSKTLDQSTLPALQWREMQSFVSVFVSRLCILHDPVEGGLAFEVGCHP